jgi:hypothetical protein
MRRMARRSGRMLQRESASRWVYRNPPLSFLAPLVVSLTGVILIAAFAIKLGSSATLTAWFFLAILASGFAYIGIATAWEKATPMVFDLAAGFYWLGHKHPLALQSPGSLKEYAAIGDIHALQLLRKRVRAKNASYLTHELNLVLINGARIHLWDCRNPGISRNEAQLLAAFLKRPLWDAVQTPQKSEKLQS